MAAIAQALRLHHYLYLAPLTFLYYDHLLTFGDEVRYIWNKPKTPSAYCFFLNRYLAAFGDVAVTVFSYHKVPESWSDPFHLILILLSKSSLKLQSVFFLRYEFMRSLLAVSIWAASGAGGVPQRGEPGCNIADPRHVAILIAIPWEAVFVYDVMIFSLLFYKSQRDSGLRWAKIPIVNLLIRDGSIYFALMATVNLANILTSYIAEPLLVSCLSTFASKCVLLALSFLAPEPPHSPSVGSMSVTMMSRLMLNLHAVESTGIFSTSASCSTEITELDTLQTRDLERSAGLIVLDPSQSKTMTRAPTVIDPEPWGDRVQHHEFSPHLENP
ncbi:hypothetical protein K438DRAFT_1987014 [Mycena galopus ATCC 62051]|nr:hypothetical protein K438DRAFT_1987014 [Mycena galopus ATCC 62051]